MIALRTSFAAPKLNSDPFTFKSDTARDTWQQRAEILEVTQPNDLHFCTKLAAHVEKIMPQCASVGDHGFNEAVGISYLHLTKQDQKISPPSVDTLNKFLGDTWAHGDKLAAWSGQGRGTSPMPNHMYA